MNQRISDRRSAFTLVELLVVIGIVTVLMAMLLPALNKARDAAATLTCASQLRQVGIAWNMYTNDYKGWYCAAARSFSDAGGSGAGWGQDNYSNTLWGSQPDLIAHGRWYNLLVELYLKNYNIVNCPTRSQMLTPLFNTSPGYDTNAMNQYTVRNGINVWRGMCYANAVNGRQDSVRWDCNYSYQGWLFGTSSEANNPWYAANDPQRKPKKWATLKQYLKAVIAANSNNLGAMPDVNNIIVVCDGAFYFSQLFHDSSNCNGILDNWRWVHSSGKRMNILLMDGHVDTVSKGDIKWMSYTVAGFGQPGIVFSSH